MMDQQPMMGYGGQMGGGAKKFNTSWKSIFFAGGVATTAGGLLGYWSMLGSIVSPFDFVIFGYITVFGLIMILLDAPMEHPRITEFKMGIYKFCLFLTRFIGRGIAYLFLGSMVCGNLWDYSMGFLGFIIFGFLTVIGGAAIYKGFQITKKLDVVKKALLNRGGPTPSICPPQGLRIDKFGELALKIQGIAFTQEELGYVANALSQTIHADDVISQREFEFWLKDPTPVII